MLWDAEFVTNFELTVQKIVDAFAALLDKIFGFIADSEGWVEEDTAA